jgi:Tfp pilus assembly protein PilE
MISTNFYTPKNHQGVTIMEIVVTICILALLAGISYSNYNTAKMQTQRNDAKEALVSTEALVERYLAANNQGTNSLTPSVINLQFPNYASNSATPVYSKNQLYKIVLTQSGTGYAITATAVYNGQACDSSNLQQQCLDLTCRQIAIDNYNKISYNSNGVLANAATTTCW